MLIYNTAGVLYLLSTTLSENFPACSSTNDSMTTTVQSYKTQILYQV